MFKGAVKQTILLAMVLAALTGCASTADGIRFGHGPAPTTETDVAKAKQQLIDNAKSSAAKAAIKGAISVQSGPGIIVVGTVGPLRTVDGEKRHAFYVSYNNDAQKFHPGKPNSLTEDNFVKTIAGWTSVEIFSIPGVVNQRLPALVKDNDKAVVVFPSTFGSFMVGTTGDLVGVRSNADGVLILDRVLCQDKDPEYRTCAKQFERGRFDATTGQELDGFKPKTNGVQIDVATYKLASKKS